MADIFISYKSSDRPRAIVLQNWFEAAGWNVFVDRHTDVGEEWERRIEQELTAARVVVVIWSAEARRSEWVVREATIALKDNRLIQIYATGLPLFPPFDAVQGIRMQSWMGEGSHDERQRLFVAVAAKLGVPPPSIIDRREEVRSRIDVDYWEVAELVFFYCGLRLELQRLLRAKAVITDERLAELRGTFEGILAKVDPDAADDRHGTLHAMIDGFHQRLELLAPSSGDGE
jgi:hypothetical protein